MYNKNVYNGYSPYNSQYGLKPTYAPTYQYNNGFMANSPYSAPQMANMQPQLSYENTNHIFVTSLEDALSRTAPPNSEIGYLHQDKPLFFNIKTDNLGKKTYTTFELREYSPEKEIKEEKQEIKEEPINLNNYVHIDKFNALSEEFETLKSSFNKIVTAIKNKSKGETVNE